MRLVFRYFYVLVSSCCSFLFADSLCTCEFFDQGHALEEHVLRNGYNSPACIELDAGFNVILKGSCLYWSASEQGLDLGYSFSNNSYQIHKLHFDYNLGAKGSLGFHLPHDNWDFTFSYLYYRNHKSSSEIQSSTFVDYWYNESIVSSIEGINQISSKWKLTMDIMDAFFSRPFYLGSKLTVEPFIGARGGWINQKYKVPGSSNDYIYHQFDNKSRSDSWVLGGLGGFNTNWIISGFFRIYANFSGSLLYQRFKVTNNQKIILDNVAISNEGTKSKFRNVSPSLDTSFGLAWGTYFYNKRLHIDFSFGYDYLIFFDQNAISYVVGEINQKMPGATLNNLMLHGISGALRLDF